MTQDITKLLIDTTNSFVSGSFSSFAISVLFNLFSNKFNIKKEKFKEKLVFDFQTSLRNNAINSVVYHTSNLILQKIFNEDNQFEKTLWINAGSAGLSSLAVNAIVNNINYKTIGSAILSASIEYVNSIIRNWNNGGKKFTEIYFPQIYAIIDNNKELQRILKIEKKN